MRTVTLDCPRCGGEVSVGITYSGKHSSASFAGPEEWPTPEVVSLECSQHCELSLQEENDLESEALAIADCDVDEAAEYEEWKRSGGCDRLEEREW